MYSICHPNSPYLQLAEMQDTLGFQNLVEGRISCLYLTMRQWTMGYHSSETWMTCCPLVQRPNTSPASDYPPAVVIP
jgi:hypothetical protein